MRYVNSLALQVSIDNSYLFMWISPTASPNYSEKELNSNGPNNAIMLLTPLRRNYVKCHFCNIQTLINLLIYSQMLPTTDIPAFYIRHKTKSLINQFWLLIFQEVSTAHSNFGMSFITNTMPSLLINSHFTSQGQSAFCIVTINLWHHFNDRNEESNYGQRGTQAATIL